MSRGNGMCCYLKQKVFILLNYFVMDGVLTIVIDEGITGIRIIVLLIIYFTKRTDDKPPVLLLVVAQSVRHCGFLD